MFFRSLIAASIALSAAGANAYTVFEDNFNGYGADQLNWNAATSPWTVSNGTVDVIGAGGSYDFIPGNGSYLDLDGSTNLAGLISTSLNLTAGVQYTATFQLAGNHRGAGDDTVDAIFGGASGAYTLTSGAGFTTYSLVFTPTTTQTYTLSFDDRGTDNQGALLDNVKVTAVPEPGSLALVLAGLGVVGFAARRRF